MHKNVRKCIPNLFTFFNLTLGFLAIIAALQNDLQLGALLIILSGIMDRFDGKVARKLDVVSALGKQLDSLSDLVSFGVAPAVIIWASSLKNLNLIGTMIVVFFVLCGTYRLARFNITEQTTEFIGIPITAAGCLTAVDILFIHKYGEHTYFSALCVFLLSLLMISKFKIKKM